MAEDDTSAVTAFKVYEFTDGTGTSVFPIHWVKDGKVKS